MGDPDDETKECFALRPMTCPFQYQVFLNRMALLSGSADASGETSTLFRNEESGEMHGLIRVRQFTISEGHLMCTPEQLETEFRGCVELAQFMMDAIGFNRRHHVPFQPAGSCEQGKVRRNRRTVGSRGRRNASHSQ